MSVTVTGGAELARKMQMLGDQMEKAADQGVYLTAEEVRETAIKSIQTQSPGKPVKRSRQGGGTYSHIAANEGSAPNTDTGKLVSSISSEKVMLGEYEVGSNLPYAEYLEFGTKKMRPRPWLYPALEHNKKNLMVNIEKVADIYIKRLTK